MEAFDTLSIESLAEEEAWVKSALGLTKSQSAKGARRRLPVVRRDTSSKFEVNLQDDEEDDTEQAEVDMILNQIQHLYAKLDDIRQTQEQDKFGHGTNRKIIMASMTLPVTIERTDHSGSPWRLESLPITEMVLNPRKFRVEDFHHVHWVGTPSSNIEPGDQSSLRSFLSDVNAASFANPDDIHNTDNLDDSNTANPTAATGGTSCSMSPVFLEPHVHRMHYEGFCKSVLWPLFHSAAPTGEFHSNMHDSEFDNEMSEEGMWQSYTTVNQKFADEIRELYEEGDMIWIHGYHLMLLPELLRNHLPDSAIGFFLHVPFPSSEFYRILTYREQLLEGLLGSTLIGFQTFNYARHFLSVCTRILGLNSSPKGVEQQGRFTRVTTLPVGVDTEPFRALATSKRVQSKIKQLRLDFEGKRIFLGVDQVIESAGILHRMYGFEELLAHNPNLVGDVALVQMICGRCDAELVSRVHEFGARINGKFSLLSGSGGGPVYIVDRRDCEISSKFDLEITALFCVADVLVVTPLRDGMNLRPYQYVTCRNAVNEYSSIVLSEFAGAAHSLGSGAILVNPWDTDAVTDALLDSLIQPPAMRRSRHNNNVKIIKTCTATSWSQTFLEQLEIGYTDGRQTSYLKELDQRDVVTAYESSGRKLLVFDNEGVLVQAQSLSELSVPSVRTIALLRELSKDPDTTILVVSRRMKSVVEKWFYGLNIILAAESGAFLRWGPSEPWISLAEEDYLESSLFETTTNLDKLVSPRISPAPSMSEQLTSSLQQANPITTTVDSASMPPFNIESATDLPISSSTAIAALASGGDVDMEHHQASLSSGNTILSKLFRENATEEPDPGKQRERVSRSGSVSVASRMSDAYSSLPSSHRDSVVGLSARSMNDVWRAEILPLMEYYVERTPGSTIESLDTAIAWHYYDANPEHGNWQANNLMVSLAEFCNRLPIAVTAERYTIRVRLQSISKSRLLMEVLKGLVWQGLHAIDPSAGSSGMDGASGAANPTPSVSTTPTMTKSFSSPSHMDGSPFNGMGSLFTRAISVPFSLNQLASDELLDVESVLDMLLVITSGEDATEEKLFVALSQDDEEAGIDSVKTMEESEASGGTFPTKTRLPGSPNVPPTSVLATNAIKTAEMVASCSPPMKPQSLAEGRPDSASKVSAGRVNTKSPTMAPQEDPTGAKNGFVNHQKLKLPRQVFTAAVGVKMTKATNFVASIKKVHLLLETMVEAKAKRDAGGS